MKSITLSGFPRENVGKKESRALRREGKVPCVLYGAGEQAHFWVFGYDLKSILYTKHTYIVQVNIDGKTYDCVVKESQYHPISEGILHVDFLMLDMKKAVSVEVPVDYTGIAPGLKTGGKFVSVLRKLTVRAIPADLPDSVMIDISSLQLGKSIKVGELTPAGYTILNSPGNPVCQIIIPRAAKTAEEEEAEAAEGSDEETDDSSED